MNTSALRKRALAGILEAKTALPLGLSAFSRLIKSTLNPLVVPVRCC